VVEKESLRGPLELLRAAAFISTFDRFTIAPMLVTIAAALGVSLEQAAAAAVSFGPLFALAALSAIPLGLVGSAAHLSYDRAS
jgi:predicted MFS family arabinose efflux permease